jgi:hypothetical protein
MAFKFVRRGDRVAFRAYGDGSGGVLLDLDTSLYFGVNGVGALVWELIGSGNDVTSIIEEMRKRFENAPPDLSDDVHHFLSELGERHLIRMEDHPAVSR